MTLIALSGHSTRTRVCPLCDSLQWWLIRFLIILLGA